MTDDRRRLICRACFLLGCVIPTVAVFYCRVHLWSANDWETVIAAKTGLRLEISQVENPRPGITVLVGVKLFSPDWEPIGSASQIEVDAVRKKIAVSPGAILQAVGVQHLVSSIEPAQFPAFGEPEIWHLICNGMQIRPPSQVSESNCLEFSRAELLLSMQPPDRLKLLKLWPTPDCIKPIEFKQSTGQSSAGQDTLSQSVGTEGEFVPVWLLDSIGGHTSDFGDAAHFCGAVELAKTDSSWSGCVRGRLGNLDLERFSKKIGSPITGVCEVQIDELTIENGKIKSARLSAHNGVGSINAELVKALGHLPSLKGPDSDDLAERMEFSHLALTILIRQGVCSLIPIDQSGTLIASKSGELLQMVDERIAEVDLERMGRILVEPCRPDLLVDDQFVELLRHFHLPPDSRSARAKPSDDARQY